MVLTYGWSGSEERVIFFSVHSFQQLTLYHKLKLKFIQDFISKRLSLPVDMHVSPTGSNAMNVSPLSDGSFCSRRLRRESLVSFFSTSSVVFHSYGCCEYYASATMFGFFFHFMGLLWSPVRLIGYHILWIFLWGESNWSTSSPYNLDHWAYTQAVCYYQWPCIVFI